MEALKPYREKIDALDKDIIRLFRKRFDIIDEVGALKKREAIPAALQDRIDEVKDNAASYAESLGLNPDLFRTLWAALIAESCAREDILINNENDTHA